MRIAGNKLKHLIGFFHSELKGIYPDSEIEAMMTVAVEEILGFSKTEILLKQEENINQSDLLKLYDCAKDLKKIFPCNTFLVQRGFTILNLR